MLARSKLPARVDPRGLVQILLRSFSRVLEAERRFREAERLTNLDDRMLRDIGITRAQAEAEAHRLKAPGPIGLLGRQGSW